MSYESAIFLFSGGAEGKGEESGEVDVIFSSGENNKPLLVIKTVHYLVVQGTDLEPGVSEFEQQLYFQP